MAEAGLPTRDFNVEVYYRLADIGVLTWDDHRDELLNGQNYDILLPGSFHAGVNNRLETIFHRAGGERWLVRSQAPVRLNNGSEPQPDVALVKLRDDFYAESHPQAEDILLLVEVANSSVRFDREEQRPAYARAGIRECWIVNLVEKMVEVYRQPLASGLYALSAEMQGESQIFPEAFPDVVIKVADLLKVGR